MEDVSDVRNPATLAQKLIDAFDLSFYIKQQRLQISARMGINLFPKDGQDTHILIKKADAAMYQAKKRAEITFNIIAPS
jgi:predicted signal transduction protein with EAL and GGDEF domain